MVRLEVIEMAEPDATALDALKQYVERKERELYDISMGVREAAPEGKKNPLNNIRNLKNTIAALAKFIDFSNAVINQLQ